jgi:1-acyl-sn-glycerol-3-phosphate acyltransferase
MFGIYRVSGIKGYNRHRKGAAVYVANHRSRIDEPFLLGIIDNPISIIKGKYAKKNVFSILEKYLDFASVDPGSINSLAEASAKCSAHIAGGGNVLIFAEGARSASGKLQQFKDFAFRIARNAKIPVVPVIIHSDQPFMAKIPGSHFPCGTFSFNVRFLHPEYPADKESPADFTVRIHDIMAKELADLDRGTQWEIPQRKGLNNGK